MRLACHQALPDGCVRKYQRPCSSDSDLQVAWQLHAYNSQNSRIGIPSEQSHHGQGTLLRLVHRGAVKHQDAAVERSARERIGRDALAHHPDVGTGPVHAADEPSLLPHGCHAFYGRYL
jgi:hypothetical protein